MMRQPAAVAAIGEVGEATDAGEEVAYVGIGANLGAARERVRTAIADCAALAQTRLLASSSLYRSAPVDAGGPDYVNAVVRLATRLEPAQLLHALQQVEARHGRERPWRNAPRTLDLDLLLFGDRAIDSAKLVVPHPRLHLRAFVLQPLAELDATLAIAGRGSVHELIDRVADQRIERIDG